MTIDGSGRSITVSGNNSVRVFVVSEGADLTLKNLTVANGQADFGGGIFNDGTLTIINSTILNNDAGFVGGGILNDFGNTLTIINSTISNNDAGSFGGGIYNDTSGTVTIINSTISGNSAASFGGGIWSNGRMEIINSTISGNSAGGTGGGIHNLFLVTLKNSIIANSPSGGNCSAPAGGISASGVNFATDGTCRGFTSVTPAQLNLGPLADNGGPTQTHALLSCSAAIDAATDCTDLDNNPVTEDQRGVMRPIDGDGDGTARCDVGAYETTERAFDPVPPTITCPSNITVETNVGCTYVGGIGTARATDNCDPSVTITNNAPAAFPLGMTTVTWKATDDAGNMSTCMQTVTVVDDDAPQITCPATLTVGTNVGCTYVGGIGTARATDNCDPSVTITNNAPAAFPLGMTTVTWKATDDAGNMSTCMQTVTVVDDDAPQITCPANQTVQAGANCQATVSVGTATATDNCTASGSITITGTRSDGQMLNAPYPGPNGVGARVTTITWKATDAAGNMTTCIQTITVTNAAPTANAGPDQIVDEGAPVTLDGSGSSDPDPGQALTFQWTQTGGPPVTLTGATTATPSFTAPSVPITGCETLTFQLTVTDSCGATASDTVVVRVNDVLVLQDQGTPSRCLRIRPCTGTYCWTGPVEGTITGTVTIGPVVAGRFTFTGDNSLSGEVYGPSASGARRGSARIVSATGQQFGIQDNNINDSVCVCP